MSALVQSIGILPDGRWQVVISARPGVRVTTVLQQGPPDPALIDHLLREAESRPGLTHLPKPPAGT